MKKILSLDVGIHNLAYTISECKLPSKGSVIKLKNDIKITKFSLVDLLEDNRKKCPKILTSGKNKGKPCNQLVSGKNKFCTRHLPKTSVTTNTTATGCQFIMTRGNNKGKICGKKIIGTYCKTHDVDGCISLIKSGKNKGNLCGRKVLIGYKTCSVHCSKNIKKTNNISRNKKVINHRKLCKQIKLKLDGDVDIDGVNIVLIEEQKPKNRSMVKVSHYIFAYFAMRLPLNAKIIYLTARNRMEILCGQFKDLKFKGNKEYSDRKSNAVVLCNHLFENVWPDLNTSLYKNISKKDDISDCVVQNLWYLMRTYNSCVA
jgi:hypothetical protein